MTLQPAYILHSRSYRDTSLLLELFTPEQGRMSAVARGAKSTRSRFKGLLQPFVPLLISWVGKTDLMTLTIAEAHGAPHCLTGDALLCGIYLNELMVRLLHRYDAHPNLYTAYETALQGLQETTQLQKILREFEKKLLHELGYALQLDREAHTGNSINPGRFYFFDPNAGLLPCADNVASQSSKQIFSGENLLALHSDDFNNEIYLRDAKRLLRVALGHLLGNKPIKSREMFL